MQKQFKDTPDAAYQRMVRSAIRKSEMTKSDRDITVALVNLWFYHRNGPKGYIYPGRKRLAKKARVTIKTVSRCLAKLRAGGMVTPVENLYGEGQNPTHYTVNIHAILVFCGATWIDEYVRNMTQNVSPLYAQNVSPLAGQNVPQSICKQNMSKSETKQRKNTKCGDKNG